MKKIIVFIFSVFVILVIGKPFLKGGRGSSFFGGFAGGATGSIVGSALTSKSSRGSSDAGVRYRDLRDLEDWCRDNMKRIHSRFDDMIRALDDLERRVVHIEKELNISRPRREGTRVK